MEQKYTGKHFIGEIIYYKSHECIVENVWNYESRNGISIHPTGMYGFTIDLYDDQLEEKGAEK